MRFIHHFLCLGIAPPGAAIVKKVICSLAIVYTFIKLWTFTEVVAATSAFALLADESDGPSQSSDEEVAMKKNPPKQQGKNQKKTEKSNGEVAQTQNQGKQKKKKGKQAKVEDDEDLDAMLAELQLEYQGSGNFGQSAGTKDGGDKPKSSSKPTERELLVEEPVPEPSEEKQEEKVSKKKKKGAKKGQENAEAQPVATSAPEAEGSDKKSEKPSEGEPSIAEAAQEPAEDGKKKKGKKDKAEDKKDKKGPGKKTLAAMQEALKKIKVRISFS